MRPFQTHVSMAPEREAARGVVSFDRGQAYLPSLEEHEHDTQCPSEYQEKGRRDQQPGSALHSTTQPSVGQKG